MTNMNYTKAKDWIVGEDKFDARVLGKCEAVMSLGNGYMGLRSSTEEEYIGEKRGLFVAGTFNQFDDDEVTELPNAADLVNLTFTINGARFNLLEGTIQKYWRQLNLKTGELSRAIEWISPNGDELYIDFHRIVSLKDLHVIAQQVTLRVLNRDAEVVISSGINGQITNTGSQHFSDGNKRFYDKKYMQLLQKTGRSHIDFVLSSVLNLSIDSSPAAVSPQIILERRKMYVVYTAQLQKGQTLTVEKVSNVYTSRDKENEGLTLDELKAKALEKLKESCAKGYSALAVESAGCWDEKVWQAVPISIDCENDFDQLAVRFAQYHLQIMTPAHDNRMSIAAKGLSGEGYKGHTFWDMDIFTLPYLTFSMPEVARTMEEYRYLSLPGAHKKADANGYRGAMFPWESAWLDDGEVTPVWGAADIMTGLSTKIMSGFIEQHITADVVFGIWQYYQMTDDQDYMDRYGYELIFDTAIFWVSRLEWDESDQRYHINNVVGPDEYKEEVDDNAFTNYMAHWNITKAVEYYDELSAAKPELLQRLDQKLCLREAYREWKEKAPLVLRPQPRYDLVIPQDKTYLTLQEIDLTKYKNQTNVGRMFLDYNLDQVRKIQVSKQADIMILFLLLEDLFSQEVKQVNFDYYEPRTLHDSSLSLSTHTILANDLGKREMAYDLFQRATKIDLGPNMKTSDDGIHAASIAGIWQSVVFGFGGVRLLGHTLRVTPRLPDSWSRLSFYIYYKGERLKLDLTQTMISIYNVSGGKAVDIEVMGKPYSLAREIHIPSV